MVAAVGSEVSSAEVAISGFKSVSPTASFIKSALCCSGFDCSGFVRFVIQEAGYPIPSELIHGRELYDSFGRAISRDDVDDGDLVFFTK